MTIRIIVAWLRSHAERREEEARLPAPVGVFASRFPVRPNRLGLSLVRVEAVRGRRVDFTGVDMLDRTPVLDVKPWEQHLDIPGRPDADVAAIRGGWYQRAGMLAPDLDEEVS